MEIRFKKNLFRWQMIICCITFFFLIQELLQVSSLNQVIFHQKKPQTKQTDRAGPAGTTDFCFKASYVKCHIQYCCLRLQVMVNPSVVTQFHMPTQQWDRVSSPCTRASRCLGGPTPNSSLMRKPESIQTTCQQSLKSTSGLRWVTLNSVQERKSLPTHYLL